MRSRARRTTPDGPSGRVAVDLLFTYGTLMRGFRLHRLLAGRAEYVTEGQVSGRLVDLGSYPGALDHPAADAVIRGELYRVGDPALWGTLDSAEGPQYHRREVAVRSGDGRERTAYIYWYVAPLDGTVPIPGGDYRAHAPATSIYHQPSP